MPYTVFIIEHMPSGDFVHVFQDVLNGRLIPGGVFMTFSTGSRKFLYPNPITVTRSCDWTSES